MMPQKLSCYIVPALGAVGILAGVLFTTLMTDPPVVPTQPPQMPFSSPYANTISGSGLVEANTRNISVGSYVSGVVRDLAVTEGQEVQADAMLFQLDDRSAKADLAVQEAEWASALAQVEEARVNLADQKDPFKRVDTLRPGISVTTDRIERLRFAVRLAESRLGSAQAGLEAAKARRDAAAVTLDKLTVKAPVAGRVLKVNIRPGEFVQAGSGGTASVVMGNDKPLHVRVSLDENDLWRLKPDAAAQGALRGNRDIHFPLKFVRIEPYVIPKRALTGDTSERVDTRVMEVLYSIEASDQPLYIGQLVDVFIEAGK